MAAHESVHPEPTPNPFILNLLKDEPTVIDQPSCFLATLLINRGFILQQVQDERIFAFPRHLP